MTSRATTCQRVVVPSASVASKTSPASAVRSGASAPSPCSSSSTCPAITADPPSPGAGPKRYQPTWPTSSGSVIEPSRSTPTASMSASTPRSGAVIRTGAGLASSGRGAAGRAVASGSRSGAWGSGTVGRWEPGSSPALGAAGRARASATVAPAAAEGRASAHTVGAPTARASHRATPAAAGRISDLLRSAAGGDQPATGDPGTDQTGQGEGDHAGGQAAVVHQAGRAGVHTGRRGRRADRLGGQLVAGLFVAPGVDDCVRA